MYEKEDARQVMDDVGGRYAKWTKEESTKVSSPRKHELVRNIEEGGLR